MASQSTAINLEKRTAQLFSDHHQQIIVRTDRMFAILLLVQWGAGVVAALVVSPRTWAGSIPSVHVHVWSALICGAVISSLPVFLAFRHPGLRITRYTIAVAQMLWSALLIHLTGGRIETHFHIFGSLAFLAFYRDWTVLIPATIVVTLDHAVRGVVWPQSVYGVLTASPWRSIEHAGWVVFENIFLIRACQQSITEMRAIARQRAELEATNSRIEALVAQRTEELGESLAWKASVLESAADGIISIDENGIIQDCNGAAERLFGYESGALHGVNINTLMPVPNAAEHDGHVPTSLDTGVARIIGTRREILGLRGDGTTFPLDLSVSEVSRSGGRYFTGILRDLTTRKEREAELERLNRELQLVHRQAGMAEVATGVLHNVGNVLNSVNVTTSNLTDKMRSSRVADLTRLSELVQRHEGDLGKFIENDEKGRHIPQFLTALSKHLVSEQEDVQKDLRDLAESVDHIKNIITSQQNYARGSSITEPVNIVSLLNDVIAMHASSHGRHKITIVREFVEVPSFVADKHKLFQIFVNLVGNAKHALMDGNDLDKRLTFRVGMSGSHIKVDVIDNGVGIEPANLVRVFSYGFTTKQDGHGFGLHSSALAAKSMGATLTAHSDGPGTGARFSLELPTAPVEVSQ